MKYDLRKVNNVAIIEVKEEKLTSLEAPDVKTAMLAILSDELETFIFNLNLIKSMDSTGLGALLFGVRQAQRMDKDVCFCAAQDKVKFLIRIAHLNEVIDLYDTEDEALIDCLADAEE